ncbi:MAG: T9SS type A sorting domain-containing protein [Ignavibacteria bacterium]|nr:T9SS type A sorting domain-containing protein [Ignavibacteria bacterium]
MQPAQWLDAYIPDFKVNDDNLNSYHEYSHLGVDSSGNFIVLWNDVRRYPGEQYPSEIYCQRYNKNGSALGDNFKIVNQDSAALLDFTMLKDGRFIVAWSRTHIDSVGYQRYELFFQRFDNNANFLSNPVRVIDSSFIVFFPVILQGMSISCDDIGRFVICWSKGHDLGTKTQVFFQRYDSAGTRIGMVDSACEGSSHALAPNVAMNKDGSFVIAWDDDRNPQTTPDVYMQRYNSNGQKIGSNIKVSDDNSVSVRQAGNSLSIDGNGRIIVAWTDDRNSENSIYYQLYDNIGNPTGVNRKANILSNQFSRAGSRVSMRSDGRFVIGWLDVGFTGREQFYGRRFDFNGDPIGNPYMIPMSSVAPTEQRINDISLHGDRVYSSWMSYVSMNINKDIWCNVRGFQNPDTVIGISHNTTIAKEFRLCSPYPNPFNPILNIKFVNSNKSFVTLKIYDILGNELTTLIRGIKNPGEFKVQWNAENYPSGIYFIKLENEAGFSDIKKIILTK